MDTSSPPFLPIPRLRLTRNSASPQQDDGGTPTTPLAGPSRLIDLNSDGEEDESMQSTPKMPVAASIDPDGPISSPHTTSPADTPAARLRAILARTPFQKQLSNERPPPSPSVLESDFDPPKYSPEKNSMAQESLKDIFTRALRDPGDTPQKRHRRRNSIDVSEVEASPRVERERAKYKGKRRSLSDEEVEKPSKMEQRSETSFRSSQAIAFDSLRQRLTNSHGKDKNQPPPTPPYDLSDTEEFSDSPANPSHDAFLKDLSYSPNTPPDATSTPQRSMQIPSQLQFESNLLEQDSEMQRALKGFDSYEADSGRNQRPLSFPPARVSPSRATSMPHTSLARPPSMTHTKSYSFEKTHTAGHVHSRRASEEFERSSSRASSSMSNHDHKDPERERIREREREWNKPHPRPPPTPDLNHRLSHGSLNGSRSGSPNVFGYGHTLGLSRRGSAASLSDMSSRTSSFGSQAEYRERINELERDRNIEREREWNKPHPKTSRPSSSLSMHSPTHTRTNSHPTRPDSASSLLTPDHPSLHRRRSHSPSVSSSRASSPNGSLASRESLQEHDEVKHVVEHERERNWNAPRPKWHRHPDDRSMSPIPPSPSHMQSHARVRADSLTSPGLSQSGRHSLRATTSHSSLHTNVKPAPRPSSPLARSSSSLGRQTSRPARPTSPLPPIPHENGHDGGSKTTTPGTNSRFGWTFPRSRGQLPPLELNDHSPERPPPLSHTRIPSSPSPTPGSRPSSRASGSGRISHIPVRTARKSPDDSNATYHKGHKRTTTELSESAGGIPRKINVEAVIMKADHERRGQDSVFASDEESPSPVGTPTVKPIPPPSADETRASQRVSPRLSTTASDESRLQQAITTRSLSPPPTPPSESHPQPTLSLATPPRRSSFNTTKLEFQTPSPPKGMPELPGPPSSSSEGEQEECTPFRMDRNLTSMKTPKPPGAWTTTPRRNTPELLSESLEDTHPEGMNGALGMDLTSAKTPKAPGAWSATPAPPRRENLTRANTLPAEPDDNRSESGLATPMASLSRANSLPTQTPAPPGAWAVTPSSAKRKSILKVRFDVEAADSDNAPSEGPSGQASQAESASWKSENVQVNGDVPSSHGDNANVRSQTPELPATPVSGPPSPRSLRKSPTIHIVDAFGRAQQFQDDSNSDVKQKEDSVVGFTSTPKTRATVRIVDAMGREVEEPVSPASANKSEDIPMTHNEALVHMRHTLAELAAGFNEADRSSDLGLDDSHFHELDNISKAARDIRSKLSQTLQMAQNAEGDLRSSFGPLRESMKKSKLLQRSATIRRLPWLRPNSWIFWSMVSLQLIFILIMYRMTIARARHIFLTTYYDPFNPDLHLYITHPETLRYTMPSNAFSDTPTWSIFHAHDTLQREGWRAFAFELRDYFLLLIRDWQVWAWNTWGDGDHSPSCASWPPT